MTDNPEDHLSKTRTTFRFASGQVLTLKQNQIEKIPYVSALVSSADWFESARDEDGNLKLDRCINYEDFIYVLESLSFLSIRQLFTHLPKQTNVIPIVYLLDFLGIGPRSDLTLEEVDIAFFSTLSYDLSTEKYSRIITSSVIQDTAVRFAIAIVKEEYDFSKDEIIDQTYWLIMFILSAWKFFGTRLRYHVYAVAKNCFTVFGPSQLKSLMKLNERMSYDTECPSTTTKHDDERDSKYLHSLREMWESDYYPHDKKNDHNWSRNWFDSLRVFDFGRYRWHPEPPIEDDLLEPAYKRVLEITYGRLQGQICKCAIAVLPNIYNGEAIMWNRVTTCWGSFIVHMAEILPDTISDLFKNNLVQEEIRKLVLEELSFLVPKLKQKHVELQQKLQLYELGQNMDGEEDFNSFLLPTSFRSKYEIVQEEALCYTLLLDKLDHSSNIVITQIQQRVCKSLYNAALKQFNQWGKTHQEIKALRATQVSECHPEDSSSKLSKNAYQRYRTPAPKSVPKRQLNYSKR